MSLFGITLKKIEAIPSDIGHLFGGGSSQPNAVAQKAPGGQQPGIYQSPAQVAANRVNPNPARNNVLLNPPPPPTNTGKHDDIGHNAATDFLGKNLVKPFLQFPVDVSNQLYNHVVAPVAHLPKFSNPQQETGPVGAVARYSGATGSLKQTAESGVNDALSLTGVGGGAKVAEEAAAKVGGDAIEQQAEKAAGEKLAANPVDHPVVKATKPSKPQPGLQVDQTVPDATNQAAQQLSDLYDHNSIHAENAHNLIDKAIGYSKLFSRAGDDLQKALEGDYSLEERIAARNNLEGVASGVGATPRVQALSKVLKQLDEKGYNVLDNVNKSPLHRVQNYATRLIRSKVDPNAGPIQRGFSNIESLFNSKSGFSTSRAVHKFVSSRGDVRYGTATDLGLTKKEGAYVGQGGVHWKPQFASIEELNDKSPYQYELDHAKATNAYHSSVGRVKVGDAAKQELLNNPDQYGLVKPGDGVVVPKGYQPITKVPELAGYFAKGSDAKKIDDKLGFQRSDSVGEKAFQGLTRGVLQTIVYNPLFHGRNLNELAGLAAGKAKGAFGPAMLKKAYGDIATMSPEASTALDKEMLEQGVVHETYGTDRATVLTNAADKAGLPHLSKASSAAMSKIDWGIRKSLYHLVTNGEDALSGEQAAALVNHFLGEASSSGPIARNVGMFWHYMKTRVGIVSDAVKHPNENSGAIIAAGEQAAFIFAATKAFQEWTGNKHASIGHPGEFGLVNEANNIRHGQVGAATANMNPVITAALNQLYGKDLYTGDDLTTGKQRLQNAGSTLVAPLTNLSKVNNGKASRGQEALQTLTGVSLPHVKGAPAVPNAQNPLAAALNTKNAKAVPNEGSIKDATGITQASLYYSAKNKALGAVAGDKSATDAINYYLDNNVNPKGQSVKKNPEQALAAANAIAASPGALKAMQQLQKSQPNHDPMWDLNAKDLKTFLQYQGSRDETGEKQAMEIIDSKFNGGESLAQFNQRRDAYYQNNKFSGSSLDNPATPKYPTFSGQQQTDYQAYQTTFKNSTDSKAKSVFIQAHPDVADALLQINKYFDATNVAQGGLSVKPSVQLTPAQQSWYSWYQTLPSGTGARSSAIKSNQAMWTSITDALGKSDLINLAKQGAIDQYQGVPFSQKFLKDAYNAGQYDIRKGSDGSFTAAPPAASDTSSGSSSSRASSRSSVAKVIANEKKATQNRDAEHAARAANNLQKSIGRNAKLRGPKRLDVHMRGETNTKVRKTKGATLKPRRVAKVALKPGKQLKRATLKI